MNNSNYYNMWTHLKEKGINLPKITSEEINKEIVPVLREMEKNGIELDVDQLKSLSKQVEIKLQKIEKEIHQLAKEGFNINSPIQLSEILFKKLKLPSDEIRRTKSGYSTAASELSKLVDKHKIIKPILECRELSKLQSTYLKPLPLMVDEKSRLHTNYGQDTTTGRLTSNEPNLQNIPVKGELAVPIRRAFKASKGMSLISVDYSQIELRVVSCFADDPAMKEAFLTNQDIHARTASEIFNTSISKVTPDQRRVAKTVNFGVLYGMSPYGLSQALKISQSDAAEFIRRYFEVHKGIKDYCNRMIQIAHEEGYVETLFGLRRYLPNIRSRNRNLADAEERMAINTPVQGTAAEILKLAMIELNKRLSEKNKKEFKARMLLTIHDELIIETKKEFVSEIAKLIKDVMENTIKLCVPITVEVKTGPNWGEMKPLKIS